MKFSLKWLSKYIDLQKYKAGDLAQRLTDSGMEVEQVEDQAQSLDKVIVGQIEHLTKHPSADRLTLCQVATGVGRPLQQVVCGAKNHRQRDKVALSLPGAILPNGLNIKPSQIKGEMSFGMLCSKAELGLGEEAQGILILPEDAPVGDAFASYFGLDDVILDINVTSNRSDLLSHFGLAREMSAILSEKHLFPECTLTHLQPIQTPHIDLKVNQRDLCPRYTGRVISGVQVQKSPEWLVGHLESVGHSSINNIVDVTNFVMLDMGQPLHAFDIRFVQGQQIQVDLAKPNETFVTLDGTSLKLDGTELMIRDAQRPIALAGIMGGKNSGILDDTVDVFIESAYFKPEHVRRTSRKFGIETDSSYRFSRGVDPEATLMVLDRACRLIQEVAGGQVHKNVHDFYPKPLTQPILYLTAEDVSHRLGYTVEEQRCYDVFERLGCQVDRVSGQGAVQHLKVIPPPYRRDLLIKEDLIEEVARLEGYNKIPIGRPPNNARPQPHAREYVLQRHLSSLVRGQGYQQAVHLAFANFQKQKDFLGDMNPLRASGLCFSMNPVVLNNPLSQEQAVMRQSLLPALFDTASHNSHHKIFYGRVYEIGHVFLNQRDEAIKGSVDDKKSEGLDFDQEWRLAIMAWGRPLSAWQKEYPALVLEVKQHIVNFLKALGIVSYQWKTADPAPAFLHPGQTAFLSCEGKNVGYIGTLHPLLLKEQKISVDAVCSELNLDQLLARHPRGLKAKSFSRGPSLERDICVVVDRSVEVGQMIQGISKAGGGLLKSVTFFDMYSDPQSPQTKSLAFRLSYQKKEGTLREEDMHQIQTKILQVLEKKFNAQLKS